MNELYTEVVKEWYIQRDRLGGVGWVGGEFPDR